MTFIVTNCPVHGTTEAPDAASAHHYGEVARDCRIEREGDHFEGVTDHADWHAENGTSCWACCNLVSVIPA